IRIVDDWRRSPASGPSHYRSVMVISEKWAEQRVLMRAYAESRDQLRPTILLHGAELAIGPAGLDLNGPWGIHVGENPDGRAQDIKLELEAAARRLAGSKGNPPRLADEEPTFEREPTANWAPGAPRILPVRPAVQPPQVEHVAPVGAARIPQVPTASYVPPVQAQSFAARAEVSAAPSNPELRTTPMPRSRSRTTRHPPMGSSRTVHGYASGSGAQSAVVRLGLAPHVSARLGWLVERIVPGDFHIDPGERRVLNALGEGELTARGIGQMLNLADPVSFMEELTRKLESYNIGLVEPGEPQGGEPTYRLRR
ncbi:MAG TPA: hypothetical protein VHN14_09300, partial [Kofleriaceae bacterium]|nr:hypothetical protein [Kofleriaceae bacterium]